MESSHHFIEGGTFTDERGSLSFVNNFLLDEIKRLYIIEHPETSVVRAWQGHQVEQKWFLVVKGSFKVVLVQPDDWGNPTKELPYSEYLLSTQNFGVLHIPGGFANGFKAVEKNSKMLIFSDFSLEQSKDDEYRFEKSLWYDWEK